MPFEPKILFEDNHVIVALKPPNMLTQGDITGDVSLLDYLKNYIKDKYEKPGNVYLGMVHRMDRPVGGVLVFARTSKAAARLNKQVKDNSMVREYVCICEGEPPARFTLKDYLAKDSENNIVRAVPSYLRIGKEAILHAYTVKSQNNTSLCAVQLETGRAHQIRAQFTSNGFPLLGDRRYNKNASGQIALWGMRLTFAHPISGQNMVFVSPPPIEGNWQNYKNEIEVLNADWPNISPQIPYER
ncbi:MAG: RluA family pseudouridine synthase [Eubacteriales bacterium]|nr:RluA family pseudouridine synthase [Eubacteriales bacterium]